MAFLTPRNMPELLFKAPYGHLILQDFFEEFGQPLVSPAGNTVSGSYDVKQLPLIVFDKCSMGRAVFTE